MKNFFKNIIGWVVDTFKRTCWFLKIIWEIILQKLLENWKIALGIFLICTPLYIGFLLFLGIKVPYVGVIIGCFIGAFFGTYFDAVLDILIKVLRERKKQLARKVNE